MRDMDNEHDDTEPRATYEARVIDWGHQQKVQILFNGDVIAAARLQGLDPLLSDADRQIAKFSAGPDEVERVKENVVTVLRRVAE